MIKIILSAITITVMHSIFGLNNVSSTALNNNEPIYYSTYMGMRYNTGLSRQNVYAWTPTSGTHSIWSSEYIIIEVANNGEGVIAFLEMEDLPDYYQYKVLKIIKEDGTNIATLRLPHAIQEFCWSPSGKEIAYVLGKYNLDHFYDHKGLYVYDLDSNLSKQISDDDYYLYPALYWANYDGKLYYRKYGDESGIYVYDFQENREIKTDYRGLMFSKNGTYYYVKTDEPMPIQLYDRKTNTLVTEGKGSSVSRLALIRLAPEKWIDDTYLYAFAQGPDQQSKEQGYIFYLLDVNTGRIRKTANHILQEYSPGIVVVQKPDGSLALEEIESMPEVKPEDLPKTWDELRAEREAASKTAAP